MRAKLKVWSRRWPLIAYWLPPVAWMALIFALSAQPSLPEAPRPAWDLLLKKGAHMGAYAILLLLLWRAFSHRTQCAWPVGTAFLLTVLYAASDEFHQTFVPDRNGWIGDVMVDAVGALLGVLGVSLATRRKR